MAQSNYLKKYWAEQRRVQAENPNKEFSSIERAEIEKKRIAKERGLYILILMSIYLIAYSVYDPYVLSLTIPLFILYS